MNHFGCTFLWLFGIGVIRINRATVDCPIGFTSSIPSTGTCLKFFESGKNWYSAREDCVSYGADLVHVKSQTTADACKTLIEATVFEQYWFGLNDILTDQDYRWTNGDPLTWSYWGSFTNTHVQPNDNDHSQNCNIGDIDSSMIVPNTWQDKPCSESHPYICEYVPGDKTIKVGHYKFRQASTSTLINVEVTSTKQSVHRLGCATECLQEPMCDGYAFNKVTLSCSLLKLKETDFLERTTIQSELTGSAVYIRNG